MQCVQLAKVAFFAPKSSIFCYVMMEKKGCHFSDPTFARGRGTSFAASATIADAILPRRRSHTGNVGQTGIGYEANSHKAISIIRSKFSL